MGSLRLYETVLHNCDVDYWVKTAKKYWTEPVGVTDGCDVSFPEVLSHWGRETVIPSYSYYNDVWVNAGYFNPFEFDWLKFDGSRFDHREYVFRVLQILNEQLVLWSVDESSKATHLFYAVNQVTDYMKVLLERLDYSYLKLV